MNDFNFDKMKEFVTPDEWAKKAKEIPVTTETKTPFFVFRYARAFAVVMSLLFVVVLSVVFFAFKPEQNILPIATSTNTSEETALKTENTDSTNNTKETEKESETDKNLIIEPEESKQETESNTSEKPTQKPTSATEKIEPSEKPSESQPQTQKPTENPTQTPSTEPIIPVPSEPPSEVINKYDTYIYASIYKHLVLEDEKIFCRVYDENGVLLGDPDLYSQEHLTELSFSTYYVARYYPYRHSLITKTGFYTFVFYNSEGAIAGEITRYLKEDA